jgi:hypothetical protein
MGIKETINVGLGLIRIGLVFGIAYSRGAAAQEE